MALYFSCLRYLVLLLVDVDCMGNFKCIHLKYTPILTDVAHSRLAHKLLNVRCKDISKDCETLCVKKHVVESLKTLAKRLKTFTYIASPYLFPYLWDTLRFLSSCMVIPEALSLALMLGASALLAPPKCFAMNSTRVAIEMS